jgi:hypothetical protein
MKKKLLALLIAFLFPIAPVLAQYYPPSGGGGGGSGTVTNASVVSANGFAGTVANSTTTPAITLSTSITGILKGNGTAISAASAGTDYQAPITLTTTGTSGAATLSGNTLNIPQYSSSGGSGTVTSVTFTGDGTILSSTPSSAVTTSGTLPASLASINPYSTFANATSSSAAPTNQYALFGSQVVSSAGTTTLTNASPGYFFSTAASGTVTVTLPQASTCIGKPFYLYNNGSATVQVGLNAADNLYYNSTNSGGVAVNLVQGQSLYVVATGSAAWRVVNNIGGFSTVLGSITGAAGALAYSLGGSTLSISAAGSSGQLAQSGGTGAPTWTSSPTITHQIAGGTAPTVAVGAGAGSTGSPGATIAGHDTDFAVTVTTGTLVGTGVIFTVTFGTAYATAPYVQVTSGNAAAAALMGGATQWYPTSTTTTMVLNSGTTGLTAAGAVYVFNVHCGQ